ncbi:MAG: MATE family efflux transporter [Prevotellaceae bacterium]|nr:MATE family efflux transporter [Prevotellaceae bacterium]
MNLRDKQILHIALPSIVSNITVPLLGLVDVAITGHLGSPVYLGAIAVGGMLTNIICWFFAFLRMGTSGMTSQAFGARDFAEVVSVLLRSMLVALGIACIALCLQVPMREGLFSIVSPSAEVRDVACTYYNICIWGIPATLTLYVLTGWFVGMQNSKTPMVVAVVQNVVNIVVSFALVYWCGMKIEGVALGTVIAQYVGLGVAFALLFCYYSRLRRYLRWGLVLTRGAMMRLFQLNRDIFLRTCCLILVQSVVASVGARFGDTELAVNAILIQFVAFCGYFMDGIAFAAEAMVGKAIGARSRVVYDDTIKHIFRWGWALAAVFTVTYLCVGEQFLCMLTDEEVVIEGIHVYQHWTLLFPICGMVPFIWDGVYIGAVATRGMLIATASGMVVFFLLYWLIVPSLANHGVWIAFLAYLVTRGVSQTIMRKRVWVEYGKEGAVC